MFILLLMMLTLLLIIDTTELLLLIIDKNPCESHVNPRFTSLSSKLEASLVASEIRHSPPNHQLHRPTRWPGGIYIYWHLSSSASSSSSSSSSWYIMIIIMIYHDHHHDLSWSSSRFSIYHWSWYIIYNLSCITIVVIHNDDRIIAYGQLGSSAPPCLARWRRSLQHYVAGARARPGTSSGGSPAMPWESGEGAGEPTEIACFNECLMGFKRFNECFVLDNGV